MKALSTTRPISSPSRTDKYATPLVMRFLRSNVGSRSRGRSRSSPMFIIRSSKKNAAAMAAGVAPPLYQEPTSPKVTCIGQVRARRSKTSKRPDLEPATQNNCCYCCCCHGNDCSKRFDFSQHLRTNLKKWGRVFRFGYCKKVETRDDSIRPSRNRNRNQFSSTTSSDIEDIKSKMIQESKQAAIDCSTPPKNALLLTRCRSAPYRSSSLAGRFWGSPIGSSETEESNKEHVQEETRESTKKEMVALTDEECGMVLKSPDSDELNEELDEICKERPNKEEEEKIQDFRVSSIHPLVLTRCKSEPAETGERLLNPDINFLRQRRSDTAESCLQLSDLIS